MGLREWRLACVALIALAPFGPAERVPGNHALDCNELLKQQRYREAIEGCRAAPDRDTAKVAVGVAFAHVALGNWSEARAAAIPWLRSPYSADAAYAAGYASSRLDDHALASVLLHYALASHELAGDHRRAAKDAFELAGMARDGVQLVVARELLTRAAEHARLAGDDDTLVYIEIGIADVLRQTGAVTESEQALFRALEARPTPHIRAWIMIGLGHVYIISRLDALAAESFATALDLERASGSPHPEVMSAVLLNQAYLERQQGHLHRALELIDQAATYEVSPAELAYNRGVTRAMSTVGAELDAAGIQLSLAEQLGPVGSWAWVVADARGVLAERRGSPGVALAHYEHAIEVAEALRALSGPMAAAVSATFRATYLRALGIHARDGRWGPMLELVARLDVDDALRIEAPPGRVLANGAISGIDLDPLTDDEFATPVPRPAIAARAIADAWRGRTLIVLISDTRAVWRIVVADGVVTGRMVGDADTLEAHARSLDSPAAPYGELRDAAAALAEAIVPPGIDEAEVLLVGALGRAPLALVAAAAPDRPRLVRALAVLPVLPGPRPVKDGARVLGDPDGSLQAARDEAIAIGTVLGTSPRLGAEADIAALASATGVGVIHIAAHAKRTPNGTRLTLADREVSAGEIQAMRLRPRLVVLGSCGGASARDDAGWGSLASAFLAGGAEYVVASPWTVDDKATRLLLERFYGHGGAVDPSRALEAAQHEFAAAGARPGDWAGFVVLRRAPTQPPP